MNWAEAEVFTTENGYPRIAYRNVNVAVSYRYRDDEQLLATTQGENPMPAEIAPAPEAEAIALRDHPDPRHTPAEYMTMVQRPHVVDAALPELLRARAELLRQNPAATPEQLASVTAQFTELLQSSPAVQAIDRAHAASAVLESTVSTVTTVPVVPTVVPAVPAVPAVEQPARTARQEELDRAAEQLAWVYQRVNRHRYREKWQEAQRQWQYLQDLVNAILEGRNFTGNLSLCLETLRLQLSGWPDPNPPAMYNENRLMEEYQQNWQRVQKADRSANEALVEHFRQELAGLGSELELQWSSGRLDCLWLSAGQVVLTDEEGEVDLGVLDAGLSVRRLRCLAECGLQDHFGIEPARIAITARARTPVLSTGQRIHPNTDRVQTSFPAIEVCRQDPGHRPLCFGDELATVQAALRTGRIGDALLLALSVLKHYGRNSPYEHLSSWRENMALGECHSCNVRVTRRNGCRCTCGRIVCGPCSVAVQGRRYCIRGDLPCARHCISCSNYKLASEMTGCSTPGCENRTCLDCQAGRAARQCTVAGCAGHLCVACVACGLGGKSCAICRRYICPDHRRCCTSCHNHYCPTHYEQKKFHCPICQQTRCGQKDCAGVQCRRSSCKARCCKDCTVVRSRHRYCKNCHRDPATTDTCGTCKLSFPPEELYPFQEGAVVLRLCSRCLYVHETREEGVPHESSAEEAIEG